MTTATKRHGLAVAGDVAIHELRWLRRHAPESRKHCDDLEAAIRLEVKRGMARDRRAARRAKEQDHNHTPEAA